MLIDDIKKYLDIPIDVQTNTIETNISNLRKMFGSDFILNTKAGYRLGRV